MTGHPIPAVRVLLFLVLGVDGLAGVVLSSDEAPLQLGYPIAVAVAPAGSLFIADSKLRAILKRDGRGALSVVARSSDKDRTPLRALRAVAVEPDGSVLAADSATRDVYRIRTGEAPKPLTAGALEIPTGIVPDQDGSILVCDLRLASLLRIPRDGGVPVEIARVPAPRGLALAADGEIVVLSSGPDQLLRISPKGDVRPIVKGRPFKYPLAVAIGPGNPAYLVSDGDAATVWAVGTKGEVRALSQGSPLQRPEGLAREPSGSFLIADAGAKQVFRITIDGKLEALFKAR